MDLADKLGALSLKNASIQEKGASPKTKIQRPGEEFRIPKNFKYPFGLQIIKFARLAEDLLSLKFQKADSSLSKKVKQGDWKSECDLGYFCKLRETTVGLPETKHLPSGLLFFRDFQQGGNFSKKENHSSNK